MRNSFTVCEQAQFKHWRKQLVTAFMSDDKLGWIEAGQELRSLLRKLNAKEDVEVVVVPAAGSVRNVVPAAGSVRNREAASPVQP